MTAKLPTVKRVALVTGAARGIGAATVCKLVDDGLHVMALDWCVGEDGPFGYPQATREDLMALVDSLPKGQVLPFVGDVRHPETMVAAVEAVLSTWGRLDVVVACAAVMSGGVPLWEDRSLTELWEVDVLGVWNTATASIPVMLAGSDPSGCRFVAVSSSAGEHGLFHLAAYTTVKHAVIGLVRALAADLVGTGVTASVICPGSTDTALLKATAMFYGVSEADLVDHQLLKRALEPIEIAATICFACSHEGVVLNGSVVNATGGFSPG